MLPNYHHCPFLELSHDSSWNSVPIKYQVSISVSCQLLAVTSAFCLYGFDYARGLMEVKLCNICPLVAGLFSPIIHSRSIHAVACVGISFLLRLTIIHWLSSHLWSTLSSVAKTLGLLPHFERCEWCSCEHGWTNIRVPAFSSFGLNPKLNWIMW